MSTPIEVLRKAGIEIIWFDSLGAKSMCIQVVTDNEFRIVIDPGAAEMQPSYPLPPEEKIRLRKLAIEKIANACEKSRVLIITHYHYDHHVLPSDPHIPDPRKMFLNKTIIMKCPNKYINNSQWERARLFIEQLLKLVGEDIRKYLTKPQETEFEDPCTKLSVALSKSFGDYDERRRQLLQEGKKWFTKLASELWSRHDWVMEIELQDLKILWGDSRKFVFGTCEIQILEPWFHGVEYDRTGWVTPLIIRNRGYTVFYTSDLMGPIIEDYAEFIASLRPDIVILDGPPTYLFPYMFNRINLQRAIDNAITIIKAKPRLIIYDHHLLRERKWRERVKPVFEEAQKSDVLVLTAAEVLGDKPLIDKL